MTGHMGVQFEHVTHSKTFHAFAVDYDKRDVIAQVSLTRPRSFVRPEEDNPDTVFTDVTGQTQLPIRHEPSKVSWALATGAGRRMAAPHLLIAALSEEHGLTPVADSTLTAQGARMSRAAVRRGLIKPHPDNPNMNANAGVMVGAENEARQSLSGAYEGAYMGQWSSPRYNERGQRVSALDKFSPDQMSRAVQRVFSGRKRKREAEPEPEQGTLF